MIKSFDDLLDRLAHAAGPDAASQQSAAARNGQLTKPPGALGRLEEIAIWFAGWQGVEQPKIAAPQVVVFAGNHGVAARGVSAFPAEVTAQMVANFEAGGAAINQLARINGAAFSVHPIALNAPTSDITDGPAMSDAMCLKALNIGWQAVDPDTDLLIVGEMGIGNTTSAAAIGAALFGGDVEGWVGRGTGLDDAGLKHKAEIVRQSLAANPVTEAFNVLQALGGYEIAAMVGAIARARVDCIPLILDGFIAAAAASFLFKARPDAIAHVIAGHVSAERGHRSFLQHLGLTPLLDLGLRLGEGSGAALALPILQAALACHRGMATFAEAAVSDANAE
ncbi:MAG: nicotinate-nucleotide--dimethylbenzimidazole phosphoribosyltransferase [Pseudomonadota bacterium]